MSSIPLLDDNDDQIRESLSIEEIRIALTFLKKRFRDYTLKEIVQALTEYLVQKQTTGMSVAVTRQSMPISRVPEGLFIHHRHQPSIYEDRSLKSEQIRLIAKLYCEGGINHSLAQYFYPQLYISLHSYRTPKIYKSHLQLIAAQTINCIEKFLRYECNVQIEQLTRMQKRSLREKLINAREWMGVMHPEELKTYLAFIQRYYLNQAVEVEYKQALELYKLILQSVKGPDVEVGVDGTLTNRGLRQELRVSSGISEKTCTKDEQSALILLFKQLCSVEKVSDAMCQRYTYDIKWSIHSVKNILKRIYKSSLKRLAQTANLYMKKPVHLWFGYGDEDVATLMEYENSLQTKIILLDFYMLKKTTELKLRQFVKKVNEFYIGRYQQQNVGLEMIGVDEEIVRLPILVEDDVVEMIEIGDDADEGEVKRQSRQTLVKKEKHSGMRKKRNWIEVIQLQEEEVNEQEVFIFPQAVENGKDKAQEETDVEDMFLAKKGQVDGVRQECKEKKFDDKTLNKVKAIKDSKPPAKNDVEVKQQKQSNNGEMAQKPTVPKETPHSTARLMKATTMKDSKLNKSVDSIESEPVRVSLYGTQLATKGRRLEPALGGGRFRRKAIQQNEMQLES